MNYVKNYKEPLFIKEIELLGFDLISFLGDSIEYTIHKGIKNYYYFPVDKNTKKITLYISVSYIKTYNRIKNTVNNLLKVFFFVNIPSENLV